MKKSEIRGLLGIAATAFVLSCGTARAIDVAPGDYTLLPGGTWAALQYLQYSTANRLNVDGLGDIPQSRVDAVTGVSRVLYYGDYEGFRYGFQAYIPYGGFTKARIGGMDAPTADGFGDLTVGATAWLLQPSNPITGTTFAVTAFATTPTGNYDSTGVSIGSGTWTLTPQAAVIQGLGAGFFFDGIADVALSLNHSENGVTYSQDPSWHLQAYLRYQLSPKTSFSAGYSGKFGGDIFANDIYTGTKTRVDSVRLFANQFITPTIQLQGMFSQDLNVSGGAKNTVTQIRLLKLF